MRKRWKTSCHTDQVDILKLGLKETVLTAWPGKPSASLLIWLLLAETSNFQWISRTVYDGYPGQDFLLCSPVIAVNMFLRVMKALWGNNGSAVVATDCPSTCRKRLLSGVGSVMWYKWSDCDVAGPSARRRINVLTYKQLKWHQSVTKSQVSTWAVCALTAGCFDCYVFVFHTFHTSSLSLPAVCQLISIQLTHSVIHSKHHAVGILEGAYLWWLETPLQSEYLFKQTQSRRCKLSNSCY